MASFIRCDCGCGSEISLEDIKDPDWYVITVESTKTGKKTTHQVCRHCFDKNFGIPR